MYKAQVDSGIQALAGELLDRFAIYQPDPFCQSIALESLFASNTSLSGLQLPEQVYMFPPMRDYYRQIRVWNPNNDVPIYSFNFVETKKFHNGNKSPDIYIMGKNVLHSLVMIDLRGSPDGYIFMSYNVKVQDDTPVTIGVEPKCFLKDLDELAMECGVSNLFSGIMSKDELRSRLKILYDDAQPLKLELIKSIYEKFDDVLPNYALPIEIFEKR